MIFIKFSTINIYYFYNKKNVNFKNQSFHNQILGTKRILKAMSKIASNFGGFFFFYLVVLLP